MSSIFPIFIAVFCILPSFGRQSRYLDAVQSVFRAGSVRQGVENTTESNTETPATVLYLDPHTCSCSDIYDPVCGSNAKSYYNQCQMNCELGPNKNVTILHLGNCIPF